MCYRKFVFQIATSLSLIVAFYHLIAIFYQISPASPTRHLVFFVINLFCAYGFNKRPNFFVLIFFLLTIQQLYSHGGSLIRHWTSYQSIDFIDLFVVILIPVFFVNLVVDCKFKF